MSQRETNAAHGEKTLALQSRFLNPRRVLLSNCVYYLLTPGTNYGAEKYGSSNNSSCSLCLLPRNQSG